MTWGRSRPASPERGECRLTLRGSGEARGARTPCLGTPRTLHLLTILCASREWLFPATRMEKPRGGHKKHCDAGTGDSISLPSATAGQRLAAMRRPWSKALIPEFSPSSPGEEQGADWPSCWALSLQARPSVSAAARRIPSNSRHCSPESCASDTRWTTRTPLQFSNTQGPQLLTDHSANKRNPPEPCPDQS